MSINLKIKTDFVVDKKNLTDQLDKLQQQTNLKIKVDAPKENAYLDNINKYIHKYKIGLMDLQSYINKLKEVMYRKDGSYSGHFNNLDYSNQIKLVNALNSALKEQQKIQNKNVKTTSPINSQKELETIRQQTQLYNRLLQLQREEHSLKQRIASSSAKDNTDLQKELQTQLQINQARQNSINSKIKTNGLTNYGKEAQVLSQVVNLQEKARIKEAERNNQEEQVNRKLKEQLTIFQRMANIKLDNIQDKFGRNDDISSQVSKLRDEFNGLHVANGKIVDSTGNVNASLADCRSRLSELGNTAKNSGGFLSEIGKNLRNVANFYSAKAVVDVGKNFLSGAIGYTNEMNTMMTNVRIITGQSTEEVEGLTQKYIELGKQLGMTSQEVGQVAEEYYRQGRTVEETNELIKQTGMMATLSGMDMASATEGMTSIINGYKMSVSETSHVVDTLVSIDNNAATSVQELVTALSRCSNTASEAGVSFETLAGYAGIVSSTTRKSAETIGESLKTIMVRFQDIKLADMMGKINEIAQFVWKTCKCRYI